MTCSEVQDIAVSLVDGEPLTSAERQIVEQHLTLCRSCRLEVELERAVHEILNQRFPLANAPQETRESIRRSIETEYDTLLKRGATA